MNKEDLQIQIISSLQNALSLLDSVPAEVSKTSTDSVKAQFEYFLKACCKSSRRTQDGFNLGGSAIASIIAYIEPKLLFAYNPDKWKHVKSMYEITSPSVVLSICNDLLNDAEFNEWDKTKSQWGSAAIMYYTCFVQAKSYFDTQNVKGDDKNGKTEYVSQIPLDLPLQQIFYGAPGTGKSYGVEETIIGQQAIRTTFHPDSDYSTFVGAYKPAMERVEKKIRLNLSVEDLAMKLEEYYNDSSTGKIEGVQKFCYDYCEYLDGEFMTIKSDKLVSLTDISANYAREIDKYVNFCKLLPKPKAEKKIVYKFIPQSFIQAYVEAWRDLTKPVFLVIEEINRGNCAQIFGDIFQLLDRKGNGYSSYSINPNEDIMLYLNEVFESEGIDTNAPEEIKSGENMCLPPNLYIWATMNTSDQSLFPIDSAFKRRWDWKYVPINTRKESWTIKTSVGDFSWSSFLEKINFEIGDTTSSEDKKLGFYFCKATNNVISAEKFVSKVLFYVYNDVFKDYGLDSKEFFKNDGKVMEFQSYYNMDGTVNDVMVAKLLTNLKVESSGNEDPKDEDIDDTKRLIVTFSDGYVINEEKKVDTYVNSLARIGFDKVFELKLEFNGFKLVGDVVPGLHAYRKIGDYYVLTGGIKHFRKVSILKDISDKLGLNLTIDSDV